MKFVKKLFFYKLLKVKVSIRNVHSILLVCQFLNSINACFILGFNNVPGLLSVDYIRLSVIERYLDFKVDSSLLHNYRR